MQKKIIALAIAAAFSAPAFADTANVTVYGSANMAVESMSSGDAADGTISKGTATKISSNASKIGFKGTEDLGDGLSAIWQIESKVDFDNQTNGTSAPAGSTVVTNGGTIGTYNTFLGLSDKAMGTVLFGKHDTPYKMSTRALDAFGNTIADNRTLMGGVAGKSAAGSFDDRWGNVVAYISPAMAGVTVAVAYVDGAESSDTVATTNRGSAYSMAAMYKEGDLYATAAYEVHNFGTPSSGTIVGTVANGIEGHKESAFKAGVGYTIADLKLSAVYENNNDNLNVGAADENLYGHKSFYVAAKYALSATNTVKAAYTIGGATNSRVEFNDNDARQMSVGFDHSMSKRTTVYALYTKLTNGVNANYNLTNAGSTGGAAAVAGAGADQSALALGMKHDF